MRIIAGKFKGITLYGSKNEKTRPLKDMVRESIFNFLIHSNKISLELNNSHVLDLYSGTGSFGIECLSRQAKKIIFIEKEEIAIKILKKNIEKIKVQNSTEIVFGDVFSVIKEYKKKKFNKDHEFKFDIIFCDPPFKDKNTNELIELLIKQDLLKKNGIIILHRNTNSNEKLVPNFNIIDERTYGLSKIIFGQTP